MYSTNQIVRGISLIVALAFVTLSSTARAVDPPPDGGYPNGNTAEGDGALSALTEGSDNTALGNNALTTSTIGSVNTAVGHEALQNNVTGNSNTAVGDEALRFNTAHLNTAVGAVALLLNTSGTQNTATGALAMEFNTTGSNNAAFGFMALEINRLGSNNTALGFQALRDNNSNSNTAVGNLSLSRCKGQRNIALGDSAGIRVIHGDNNIDIGNAGGVAAESNTIRIGTPGTQQATYVAGISGVTVAGGIGVVIDTNGQLGTITSSAQYKEAIKPMNKASEAVLALQPVTFHYKKELDPTGIPQFGLVAEQVAKVDPDLVARDEAGKPYSVRYEAVNAMLLNEFLKEHRKVADQSDQIAELKTTVAELKSALKAQAAQIQNVSDQLTAQAPAPRMVADN